jgi:hypothetical protein
MGTCSSFKTLVLGAGRGILGDVRKHVTLIKTKQRTRLNLEPALILTLTKIRPRTEVLACQKHAHSSHKQVRTTLITDKIDINHIISLC